MGIDIWFEADERLSEEVLLDIIGEAGAKHSETEIGVAVATFTSGMNAYPTDADSDRNIKAEDPRGLIFAWAVVLRSAQASSGTTHSMNELERSFLGLVVAKFGALFVASFQLEETLFAYVGNGVQRCT